MILLATDRASSVDVPAFVPDDVVVHATRIPMDVVATPETLAAMEAHLEDGARVLVPGGPLVVNVHGSVLTERDLHEVIVRAIQDVIRTDGPGALGLATS